MSLAIRLSQESKTNYAPGDWIGGVVHYTAAKTDEDLECIGVSFSGTTTAHVTRNNTDMVTSSSVYKVSKGCLFRQYVKLENTKKLQGSGTFAWPFVFRIPPTAVFKEGYNDDSEDPVLSSGSPWKCENDAEAHPLPPSFCYKSAFSCSVQYQLCAKLTRLPCSVLQGQCNLTTSCEVRIIPRLHVPPRDLEIFRHRTQRYFCNFEISHKTKFEALTRKARQLGHFSSTQPCCQTGSIQLRINVPKVIVVYSQAPITPWVELTCSGCEHLAQVETVRVKSFAFDLVSLTQVRAGLHTASQVQTLSLCRSAFTLPVSAGDGSQDGPDHIRGCGGILEDLGRAAREVFRRSRAVPEFATYNIFRAYTSKFKISIDFAGKMLSFQQQNIPVQVVDYADDVGSLAGQACQPPVYTVTTDASSPGGTDLQPEDILFDDLNESYPPQYTA